MVNPHYIWLGLILLFIIVLYSSRQQAIARAKLEERFQTCNGAPTNFQVEMVSQCNPDEEDTGEFCIKQGCPANFERGRGPGADLCYPKCLDDYETNGMSRCYQKCPEGYTTNGTQCIRPKYTFKKDIRPCVGCIPKHKRHTPLPDSLSDSWGPTAPEIMVVPTVEIAGPRVPVRPTVWTTNPIATRQYFMRDGLYSISEGMEGDISPPEGKPEGSTSTQMTVAQSSTGSAMPPLQPAEHTEGHCPPGYTLYNDSQCYENCPPNYKDSGDQCTLDSYVMERNSYDRGPGIPYRNSRKKYHRLSTTCDKN